jgi:hypothetical protein
MRGEFAAVVAALAVTTSIATSCDEQGVSADTASATSRSTCVVQIVGSSPDLGKGFDEGRDCVHTRIEEELGGRKASIRCESPDGEHGSCQANWRDSKGAYCTGEFAVRVHGPALDRYVDVEEPTFVLCSTV